MRLSTSHIYKLHARLDRYLIKQLRHQQWWDWTAISNKQENISDYNCLHADSISCRLISFLIRTPICSSVLELGEHVNRGFWHDGCSLSKHLWRLRSEVDEFVLFWLWVIVVQQLCSWGPAPEQTVSQTQRMKTTWKAASVHLISESLTEPGDSVSEALTNSPGSLLPVLLDKSGVESLTVQSQHVALNELLMPCDAYSTSNSVDSIIANLFLSRAIITRDNNHREQLTWTCGYTVYMEECWEVTEF